VAAQLVASRVVLSSTELEGWVPLQASILVSYTTNVTVYVTLADVTTSHRPLCGSGCRIVR
jgi:hypothetical protein